MNSAAARAARRRGTSSSTCPLHQSSPSSAGATLRRLARPGRRDQQRARALAQRRQQVGKDVVDRASGVNAFGVGPPDFPR